MTPSRAALVVMLVLGTSVLQAEDVPATVVVRPWTLPMPEGVGTLPQSLRDSFSNAFRQKGFVVVDGSEAHPARFEAQGLLAREKGNLILQVTVVDQPSRSVVASDMISVFEGVTAFDPINTSLAAVVQKAQDYWVRVRQDPLPVPPILDPLVFLSQDEGAEVLWQGRQSAGTVTDGQVTAPYFPFPSNAVLTLTMEKAGYRTKVFDVTLNPSQTEYPLPKLEKLRIQEMHFFTQGGRLLGAGAEYRQYFLPDWAFWSAEAYPFLQWRPDVPGSRPVAHLDVGGSVGTWLYFTADSWFRLGFQASLGLGATGTISSQTPGWYLDGTVSPFGLLVEWNLWGVLIENRLQVPYSLGFASGVLPQRWLLVGGTSPMLSIGTVWKW